MAKFESQIQKIMKMSDDDITEFFTRRGVDVANLKGVNVSMPCAVKELESISNVALDFAEFNIKTISVRGLTEIMFEGNQTMSVIRSVAFLQEDDLVFIAHYSEFPLYTERNIAALRTYLKIIERLAVRLDEHEAINNERDRAWDVIARVRDESERVENDADTYDIIDALEKAGLMSYTSKVSQ